MSVFRAGSTAWITGGSSGIGLAVAQLCLKHQMRVAIVDKNTETLDLATKTLASSDVVTYNVDVSKERDWSDLKQKVEAKFGQVEFLMLNAGIGARGTWGDSDYFHKIMDTNLFGVINGLNTFVPTFQSRTSSNRSPSAIVITGSKQGITNPPGNAAYNASKAAVKALAEHLNFDLRDSNTSVHLLVPGRSPGWYSGNNPGQNKEKPSGAWYPSQVADYMYEKMQAGKFYIICPDDDVSEQTDKKRMLWSVGDIVNGRPPLTRWRPEFKDEAENWMKECNV
ncbi:short chain dehydrogenase/reductase [Zopfia rhizophila CBS 207.26]|uniref:Short chain dehydrogenase/reductase n=1 Tax=Zopfia rhizophila CBS 207.26 TaxID=1314779 RepID=A0A6A6EQ79_9PEZI|nr:short chain dehydrogenase/reductase [Zopfia rhizophila CBS 207.26]